MDSVLGHSFLLPTAFFDLSYNDISRYGAWAGEFRELRLGSPKEASRSGSAVPSKTTESIFTSQKSNHARFHNELELEKCAYFFAKGFPGLQVYFEECIIPAQTAGSVPQFDQDNLEKKF